MKTSIAWVVAGLAGAGVMLTGCGPREEAAAPEPEVPGEAASPSFGAVAKELQLGGDVYLYMDTEGVFEDFNETLNQLKQDMAQIGAQQGNNQMAMLGALDTSQIFSDLGLTGINAIGLSSTRQGQGYHNRAFVYMPEGPTGILNYVGKPAHPFGIVEQAPAEADIVFHQDVSPAMVVASLRAFLSKLGPAGGFMEMGMAQPIAPDLPLTWADLAQSEDMAVSFVLVLDPENRMELPGDASGPDELALEGYTLPGMDFYFSMRLQGMDIAMLAEAAGQEPETTVTSEGTRHYLTFETEADALMEPVGLLDEEAETFAFASSRAFLDTVLDGGGDFAGSPDFQAATEGLPAEGNALFYLSPTVFAELKTVREAAGKANPQVAAGIEMMRLWFPLLFTEPGEHGYASMSAWRADGILSAANWPSSHRRTVLMGGPGGQVYVGLLAAMAIPAFNKVRETASEKQVINDGRMIASAAQQYMLEEGVDTVGFRLDAAGNVEGPLGEYIGSLSDGIEVVDGEVEYDGEFTLRHRGTTYLFGSDGRLIEQY